ncbi:MAG: insulinase family protein [Oscillospiraceae bacterium]|nr:insulinase family protein [Oscillospiraceae bacterium]
MKILECKQINEKYMEIDHETGLKILLYPMEGYKSSHVIFGTNYGSIDNSFKNKDDKDFIEVPDGIAHFLEHKLFENEDGSDVFSLFAKTGASANAYTSFDKTCYLFSCVDNLEESLKILLSFVRNPYFSDETVKKEQGIIGQEIEMYNDNGNWRVFFNLLGALYHKNPVKTDIAGSIESISQIDYNILYTTYKKFYNLSNMVLVLAGNFNPDTILDIVSNSLVKDIDFSIEKKVYDEPESVCKKEIEQNLSVSIPLFNIGYKFRACHGKEIVKKELMASFIIESIASQSSELYDKLYKEGLINSSFGGETITGPGYFSIIFGGESNTPKRVYEELKKSIEELKITGISKDDFNRCKKFFYGNMIKKFNNVEAVANSLVSNYFKGATIFDEIDIINKLDINDINRMIREDFLNENSAISIVNPIK